MFGARAAALRATASCQRQVVGRRPFDSSLLATGYAGGALRRTWASTTLQQRIQLPCSQFRTNIDFRRAYSVGTSSGPGRKDGEDNAPSTGAASSRESDPILPTEANVESLSQMEDTAAAAAGGTTSLPGTEGAPSPDSIPPPAPQFPARTGRKGGADGLPRSAYISSSDRKRDRLAHFSFALALGMIFGLTAYSGRDWDTEEEAKAHAEDAPNGWNLGNFYKRVVARKNELLNYYNEPVFDKLLPDPIPDPEFQRPYTLVLGLEDLLVHTAWDREHGWRTAKRPGLEYFLGYLNMYYEIVVFSDQPSHLAAPILEKLITYPGYISHGLTREATRYQKGIYIKDLNHLNRDVSKIIMVDTKPASAALQPHNSIIIPPWKGDLKDKELIKLINFLEFIAALGVQDVRPVIKDFEGKYIPTEFAIREAAARKKFNEKLAEEKKKKKESGPGFLGSLLGIKPPPAEQEEKMFQDQVREKGQQMYKMQLAMVAKQRGQYEEEEKQRQKEMAEAMKTSLSKILTEGLPKQPGQQ